MSEQKKAAFDLGMEFAKSLRKPNTSIDRRDQAQFSYMFAKYKLQGFDAIMQTSLQDGPDTATNWYAIRGTKQDIAEEYLRTIARADTVSFHLLDLHAPVEEQYMKRIAPSFKEFINDPVIIARAKTDKPRGLELDAISIRGLRELEVDTGRADYDAPEGRM